MHGDGPYPGDNHNACSLFPYTSPTHYYTVFLKETRMPRILDEMLAVRAALQ